MVICAERGRQASDIDSETKGSQMEEIRAAKEQIRSEAIKLVSGMNEKTKTAKVQSIENRLYEFANFLEARIVCFYIAAPNEVPTTGMLKRAYAYNKIVVLPAFEPERVKITTFKVDHPDKDLISGARGVLEPNPARCKPVPIARIDIALIPGLAFDEKGGRLGTGAGYYDRFIPELPVTTRKVALAFEEQIVPQVPTESHDKYVDIIITEKRIIYKI
jgi:5-formyltetrahydrofolate cyclo-ligase